MPNDKAADIGRISVIQQEPVVLKHGIFRVTVSRRVREVVDYFLLCGTWRTLREVESSRFGIAGICMDHGEKRRCAPDIGGESPQNSNVP